MSLLNDDFDDLLGGRSEMQLPAQRQSTGRKKRKPPIQIDGAASASPRPSKKAKKKKKQAPPAAAAASPPSHRPPTRTINFINCEGPRATKGKGTVTLKPGQGLRELKTSIKKKYGKVSHKALSTLVWVVDGETGALGGAVSSKMLVDGATLSCSYRTANGGFGFGRGRGFW